MSRKPASEGFTLLELIVVIGIFAIFAAMAYGGLDGVLKTRAQVETRLTRTEDYDRAYLRLRTDFQNGANRSVRSGTGETLPSFGYDSYTKRLEFTRGGWQNLLNLPRPTLERVSYVLDDGPTDGKPGAARRGFDDKRLVRRSWYVLDRAPQTQPVDVVLLDHVQSLTWRFMDETRTWQDSWGTASSSLGDSAQNASLPTPIAVEMTMKTQDWGELKFLFAFGAEGGNQAAKLLTAPPPVPGSDGNGNGKSDGKDDEPGGGGSTKPPPPPEPPEQ